MKLINNVEKNRGKTLGFSAIVPTDMSMYKKGSEVIIFLYIFIYCVLIIYG